MSMVTTLVSLSQFFRSMAVRLRNKAIKAIKARIAVVEAQQVKVEERRSKLMIDCHNRFYREADELSRKKQEAIDAIVAQYNKDAGKLAASFEEKKRSIALVAQGASNELKRELAMLGAELDNLTK